MMLKMLSFKLLLLAVALGFFEGDAKFGERSEGSGVRRRRCLNGNPPKRLKKKDRRMMSQPELLSGGDGTWTSVAAARGLSTLLVLGCRDFSSCCTGAPSSCGSWALEYRLSSCGE